MTASSQLYARFQNDNPEQEFNDSLIFWRERDDAVGYLEDVFAALEVVPGITFRGVTVERDESKIPRDLMYNDIEPSRLELAQVHFHLELQDNVLDITLSIFLPKLVDRLFYHLNGSIYYPILQLVDRGTYVTRKTFTLKTLLMPLVFRRDTQVTMKDMLSETEHTELVYTLDLFRSRINVFRYFFANRGWGETLHYFGMDETLIVLPKEDALTLDPVEWRAHEIKGTAGLAIAASREWIAQDPHYHGAMMATLVDAFDGVQRKFIESDEIPQWKRRLGKYFTQTVDRIITGKFNRRCIFNFHRIILGDNAHDRVIADEGITSPFFTALNTLQQKIIIAAFPHKIQEADWGHHVGKNLCTYRNSAEVFFIFFYFL